MKQTNKIKFTTLAKFQEKQLQAWYSLLKPQCKYQLYGGAAGGGKSYYLRWSAVGLSIYYALKYKMSQIPIGLFSEDYPTLRDRQITKISREFPTWLGVLKDTQKEGFGFYLTPEYGSGIIKLRNLDDPSKYASVEFAAIFVEELTKNKEDTFEDLRTRLRFPGIEERKFVAGTNPGQIGHGWVKRKWVKPDPQYIDIEQDRFFFIPAKSTDNKYNPEDYIYQLQAISDPQKRKALLDGSWDVFAGQYFEEWDERKHVITPFVPYKDSTIIVGGLDWGRTHPFSFHLSTVEKVFTKGDYFYRVKTFFEAYGTNKNPREWSRTIKEGLKLFKITLNDIAWIRGDILAEDNRDSISIKDQFIEEDQGWNRILLPADKSRGSRIAGWTAMHDWLSIAPDGLPYWQVTSNCRNLTRTIPDLVHDENNVEDIDSEGEDHAADDQRYMLKHIKWLGGKTGMLHTRKFQPEDITGFSTPIQTSTAYRVPLAAWVPRRNRL